MSCLLSAMGLCMRRLCFHLSDKYFGVNARLASRGARAEAVLCKDDILPFFLGLDVIRRENLRRQSQKRDQIFFFTVAILHLLGLRSGTTADLFHCPSFHTSRPGLCAPGAFFCVNLWARPVSIAAGLFWWPCPLATHLDVFTLGARRQAV